MVFLYGLGIRLYLLLVWLVSPFNSKASLWLNGRKRWSERLRKAIDNNEPIAWFHCASLGEFEQGRPLIEAYKEKYPDHKILITFFSPSGYEVRKNYSGADYVFYLPIDTRHNAKRFVSIVNPVVAVFIKYEFWHYILNELKHKNIPTYLVSAIFRQGQIFFRWYGFWNRRMLHCFSHIFVQNDISKQLLNSLNLFNVDVTGDTRFDRVYATAKSSEKLPLLDEFCQDYPVIVAGSTWPKDEELLISFIKKTNHRVKLIIAPHEIVENRIKSIIESIGMSTIRFSKPDIRLVKDSKVLIIDTMGILSSTYRYGHIAYVGGGFGAGIHNTLEPATFGLPILFGPHYQKFREAKELIELKAAFSITDENELISKLTYLLNHKDQLVNAGATSSKYVEKNIGATQKVLAMITPKPQ
jgi:3-deoxy-D-manno-octulosonic-acid transferase